MCAGLTLLQQLLAWPALMASTANALCALLKDLLEDAAAPARCPAAQVRAQLFSTTQAFISAFGLSVTEVLAPALADCAWAEFYAAPQPRGAAAPVATGPHGTKNSSHASGRQAKKARLNGHGAIDAEAPEALAAQHVQRPAHWHDVAKAQVLCNFWVMPRTAAPLCCPGSGNCTVHALDMVVVRPP